MRMLHAVSCLPWTRPLESALFDIFIHYWLSLVIITVADPDDGGVYEGDDENQAMLDLDNDLMEEEL